MNDTTTTTTTTDDPRQVLADIEARIINGDETVTAAALAKAKAAADLATLIEAAAERRAAIDASLQRQADAAAFRCDLDALAGEISDVQDAYGSVVDALQAFNQRVSGWQQRRAQMIARSHALGLSDEAESTLTDLGGRDWITTIADEAVGRFRTGARQITVGGMSTAASSFHALHSAQRRAAVMEQRTAQLAESAARYAEREAEKQRLRDEDEAALEAAGRQMKRDRQQVSAAVSGRVY